MTRDETKKVLMIIDTSFPNFHPKDLSFTVDLWTQMLCDYQYQEIAEALKSYILADTTGFAPSIGQLVDRVHNLRNLNKGSELTELEAWSMVYKAICNSGYNSESEFEKLPEIVQKAVGNPGVLREWSSMETDTVQSVEQSHFVRVYRSVLQQEKNNDKLPKETKERLGIKENNNRLEVKE